MIPPPPPPFHYSRQIICIIINICELRDNQNNISSSSKLYNLPKYLVHALDNFFLSFPTYFRFKMPPHLFRLEKLIPSFTCIGRDPVFNGISMEYLYSTLQINIILFPIWFIIRKFGDYHPSMTIFIPNLSHCHIVKFKTFQIRIAIYGLFPVKKSSFDKEKRQDISKSLRKG